MKACFYNSLLLLLISPMASQDQFNAPCVAFHNFTNLVDAIDSPDHSPVYVVLVHPKL